MKKLTYFWLLGVLLVLPLCYLSCSDDDESSGSADALVGVWEQTYARWEEKRDGKLWDRGETRENDYRLRFNANGSFHVAEYYNGQWDWTRAGSWTYQDGKIWVDGQFGGEKIDAHALVKKLTKKKFVYEKYEKSIESGIEYEECHYVKMRKVSEK